MTEGDKSLSLEEAIRMGRTADLLGSADDDTAGTPDHNRRVDYVEPKFDAAVDGEPDPMATQSPEPTRIEITDGDVQNSAFEMASNVQPLEEKAHNAPWNATEGDPPYVDPSSPSVEHDIEKAHSMALAENEERTRATKYRNAFGVAVDYEKKDSEGLEEVTRVLDNPPLLPFGKKNRAHQELSKRVHGEFLEQRALAKSKIAEATGNKEASEIISRIKKGNGVEVLGSLLLEARKHDERAKMLGEAAGILHDHPVSQAYKDTYPLGDYDYSTVAGIVELQTSVLPDLEEVHQELEEIIEESMTEPVSLIEAAGLLEDFVEEFEGVSIEDDFYAPKTRAIARQLKNKIDKLSSDKDATVEQIKKLAQEFPQNTLDVCEAEIEYIKKIINDVKTGKASGDDYPTPEVPDPEAFERFSRDAQHHVRQAEKWHGIADGREGPEKDKAEDIAAIHTNRAIQAEEVAEAKRPEFTEPKQGHDEWLRQQRELGSH